MVKVTGKRAVLEKLARMGPEADRQLGAVLFAIGEMVQAEAQISITNGAVSGKNHRPSRPGTPPNNDTGVLANNIETVQKGPLLVEVSSNAPYSAIHEFGGTINHPGGTPYFMRDGLAVFVSKQGAGAHHHLPVTKPHVITMPERPFMRPAIAKSKEPGRKMLQKAMVKIANGGKVIP